MMKIKNFVTTIIVLLTSCAMFAQTFSSKLDAMRNLVFNDITSTEEQVLNCYHESYTFASAEVEKAHLDYLTGIYYQAKNNKATAGKYFTMAMEKTNAVIKSAPTAYAYEIYSKALSQNCTVQSTGYMLSNATKVPGVSKKAIKLDSTNAGAIHILASFSIYAPAPFCNWNKGQKMLMNALNTAKFSKEDYFNYYCSLGYVEIKKKNFAAADQWMAKAAAIYPNNKALKQQMSYSIKNYGEDIDTSKVDYKE